MNFLLQKILHLQAFVTETSYFPNLDIGNVDAVAMTVEISKMGQEIAQLKQERNSEKVSLIKIKKVANEYTRGSQHEGSRCWHHFQFFDT